MPTPTPQTSNESPVAELDDQVLQAFRLWNEPERAGNPLRHLRLYQQLQNEEQLSARQASNRLLSRQLELLRVTHPDECAILESHFIHDQPAHLIANRMNMAEGSVFRKQKEGIHRLASLLSEQEQSQRRDQHARILTRLEAPTYSQLVGVNMLIYQLNASLLTPQSPWIVALEGMGGIGKTALADRLTRQMLVHNQWDDIGWITARQTVMNLGGAIKQVARPALTVEALVEGFVGQLLPELSPQAGISYDGRLRALTARLKETPHLLVIDNLETLIDVESLLATLRTWVNPSKILLTTRQRLLAEADIAHHSVPELDTVNALHLVRQEAQTRNLPDVLSASDDELAPIYTAVGGNPLALRLVVGQLHTHSLDQVLHELRNTGSQPVLNLYSYIYRRAWERLEEPARITLLLMLLTSERGKSFDELAQAGRSKLSADDLRHGLDRLVALSLVDSRGGLHERRYTIHGLTRTFLHRDVMGWE